MNERLKQLTDAGFVREHDPLDNGLLVNLAEGRAVAPSVLHDASAEEVEQFIRNKNEILWGISPAIQGAVLKRLHPLARAQSSDVLDVIFYDRDGNKTRDTTKLVTWFIAQPTPLAAIIDRATGGTYDYDGADEHGRHVYRERV